MGGCDTKKTGDLYDDVYTCITCSKLLWTSNLEHFTYISYNSFNDVLNCMNNEIRQADANLRKL